MQRRVRPLSVFYLAVVCIFSGTGVSLAADAANSLYFPPQDGEWSTVEPATVGWSATKLDAALGYAGEKKSSGVVVLHNGRILAERHWDMNPKPTDAQGQPNGYFYMRKSLLPNGHSREDVASVQKSVVSVLVGIGRHKGLIKIEDPVHKHLGKGWSKGTPAQESGITLRHLLTMSSGLTVSLRYADEPGTKWFYNTPAYSMSLRALAAAAGKSNNELTSEWLTDRIGMSNSGWETRPWAGDHPTANKVGFVTTARDLARFGLMIQAGGQWQGTPILADTDYLQESLRPSQQMNPSYGYLWWLNGSNPENSDARRRIAAAPADLISANGALVRRLYVVPSLGVVVTRLGDNPGRGFDNEFWDRLMLAAPNR